MDLNLKSGDQVAVIKRDRDGYETSRWTGTVVEDYDGSTGAVMVSPGVDAGETIIFVDVRSYDIAVLKP